MGFLLGPKIEAAPEPDPAIAEQEAFKEQMNAQKRRRLAQGAFSGLGLKQLTFPGLGGVNPATANKTNANI